MLFHADGFDHYGIGLSQAATSAIMAADNYTEASGGVAIIAASGGINGLGQCQFQQYQGGLKFGLISSLKISQQMKFFWPTLPNTDGWGPSFMDGSANEFIKFFFRQNGAITVSTSATFTNTGAYLATTPAGIVRSNTWQHFEFVYQPNTNGGAPFNGQISIWQEGVPILIINGLNISIQVGNIFCGMNFIVGSGPFVSIKDWICADASGAVNNVIPIGPKTTETRIVNGNGANVAWIANGAASQWQCVNKTTPATAPYTESDTPGDLQDYTVPASPNSISSVAGVLIKAYAQKTTAGVSTFELGIQSGGTLFNSPQITPGVSFVFWNAPFVETDPNTLAAWTTAAYNALGIRTSRVQ